MTNARRWKVCAEGRGILSIRDLNSATTDCRRYSVQKERLTAPFGHQLPALLHDLVDLALTVYAADRLIRRRQPDQGPDDWTWERQFEVHLRVSEPERWEQPELVSRLSQALDYLTEDRWRFSFSSRPALSNAPVQGRLFPFRLPAKVALFSGGLDSLAGLACQLSQSDPENIITVTCGTSSRLLKRQRTLLTALNRSAVGKLLPVILPVRLSQDRRSYNSNERSQRTRAFLFCVLGYVAAMMGGVTDLLVLENGIGAINLPLSDAQLGAQSSRASHPVGLKKLESFLRLLLDPGFRIRLPYLLATKGELCARLRGSRFEQLAIHSISCDGFPPRSVGPEQCGTCTSCILRRQALYVSGIVDDRRAKWYKHDILEGMDRISAPRLLPLWDMLAQIDRIDCSISSSAPWENITTEFPELREIAELLASQASEPIMEDRYRKQLIALYRRYCDEWHRFHAHPPGWTFSLPDLRKSA
jgi:hypothetical protein